MAYLNPDDKRVNKPPKIGGEGGINAITGEMNLGYTKGPPNPDPYGGMLDKVAKRPMYPSHVGRK